MTRDLRIAFFGDSFVNGTGDPACQGWTGRVCAKASRGLQLTHYNLGIRRNTSADVRARWRAEAELRLAAEGDGRLVFSFGINDTVFEQGQRRVPEAESVANFSAIVSAAAAWLPTLVVGPPAVSEDNPRSSNERISALSTAFAARSAELGVPYLDVFTPLRASSAWHEAVLAGDGVHPGANGYELLAELVVEWSAWRVLVEAD